MAAKGIAQLGAGGPMPARASAPSQPAAAYLPVQLTSISTHTVTGWGRARARPPASTNKKPRLAAIGHQPLLGSGLSQALKRSEAALHQLAHQIATALLEAGQLVGFQATHRQPCHLVDVSTELVGQLLAGGAASTGDH